MTQPVLDHLLASYSVSGVFEEAIFEAMTTTRTRESRPHSIQGVNLRRHFLQVMEIREEVIALETISHDVIAVAAFERERFGVRVAVEIAFDVP
jgi:hypothetical protein